MEKHKIIIPEEVRYHLLRHFELPAEEMIRLITASGYGAGQIKQELSLPGSKFYSTFARSPEEVLSRFEVNGCSEIIGLNGNIQMCGNFSKDLFPEGIGSASVIPLHQISDMEKNKIYTAKNRGYDLKHLKVAVLPDTWDATVIVKPTATNQMLITAFPGSAAMPIPEPSMKEELFNACRDFWDRHLFLLSA